MSDTLIPVGALDQIVRQQERIEQIERELNEAKREVASGQFVQLKKEHKEMNKWKACAEELAKALTNFVPVEEALSRFNKLKDQTK